MLNTRTARNVRQLIRADVASGPAIAIGLAAVFVSTALRLLIDPLVGQGFSFATYFVGVIAAAAIAGFRGATVALIGSTLVAWWLFVPSRYSFALADGPDLIAIIVFLINAGISGCVAAGLRLVLVRLAASDARQRLLNDELNHRVKNTLATVQSLARQTDRETAGTPAFREAFESRLLALARAHSLLTDRAWSDTELGHLVRQILEPHDLQSGRVTAAGPEVRLTSGATVSMALALHELATNAVKHGALRVEGGRVDVSWHVGEGRSLEFLWRETGSPGISLPTHQGFGTRLLRAVSRELGGRVDVEPTRDGYSCRWRVPLTDKVSLAAA